MANRPVASFVRPVMPGERNGQAVHTASKEEAKKANITGASALPLHAIVEFPFEEPIVFYQDRLNSEDKNWYIGATVNGKDRPILIGTFTRTDFNGDGEPISPEVSEFARQYDNPWDLAEALQGKVLEVVDQKKCQTSIWRNGEATDKMRTQPYPVLKFKA